jgi:hypothetical protein
MRRIIALLTVTSIVVWSCTVEPVDNLPATDGVSGFVQKGPFVSGSNIIVQVLDEEFNPTGQSYTVTTIDDFGSFELESEVSGVYVEFIAQGFYFNEVAGQISNTLLTLRALAKVTPELKSNINILTTLSKNRIIHLVKEEDKSFEEAKLQAETEILTIFNIELTEAFDFNQMDISHDGEQNAALLAISAIMQGYQTVGQLSELISKVILDVETDGTIEAPQVDIKIRANAAILSLETIENNLANRYSQLGLKRTIPAFEKYAKRLVPVGVIKKVPTDNATDVPYDIAGISITYNKAHDPATVNSNSVTLKTSDGQAVAGQVLYDADSFKIRFVPTAELDPERSYKLTVTSTAKMVDGTDFTGSETAFTTVDIDIDSDLLAYFPMNGDANDATGHGFNATGTNISFDTGINSQACKFAGEGSYVEIPNVMNLTSKVWTYSIWFQLDEFTPGVAPMLLATRLSANAFWDLPLYIRSSVKTLATYNESALNTGDNTVTANNWHHAAIVIKNGTIRMYIDGTLMASNDNFWSHQMTPGDADFPGNATGSYESYTGKYYISEKFRGESFPGYLKGSVDNVRFYSRALNKYEIKKLFTGKQ